MGRRVAVTLKCYTNITFPQPSGRRHRRASLNPMPDTLFDKIWNAHTVRHLDDGSSLVYVDRLFLHERTGSVALQSLQDEGRSVRNPAQVFATMDHILDTVPGRGDKTTVPGGEAFIKTMRRTSTDAGISLFDIDDPRHGITHLIAAEQGIALPGLVVACPDSHTCTLGALGTIGWGIGYERLRARVRPPNALRGEQAAANARTFCRTTGCWRDRKGPRFCT